MFTYLPYLHRLRSDEKFPNFDFRTRLPGFSDCSLKSLQKINDACLYNVPTYKVTITEKEEGGIADDNLFKNYQPFNYKQP